MSTSTVVDEIKLKAPTWSRDGSRSILAMMNRAQNFLFSKPSLLSTYVDPGTGDYPVLATTDDVRDYEVPDVPFTYQPDNDLLAPKVTAQLRIHCVHEIFSERHHCHDYGFCFRPPFFTFAGKKIIWTFTPKPALQNTRARVTFPFDPGTHAKRYKMLAVMEPLQLTADSIPLMVQQDDEADIIEGALSYIEFYDYGRSDRMRNFEDKIAHEFWNKYKGTETIHKTEGVNRRKF